MMRMAPPRLRATGSIRFKLTAWYAAMLFAIIVAVGASFSVVLERQLRNDVDARIEKTARDIAAEIEVYQSSETGSLLTLVPPTRLFAFPSLLIQIVQPDGTIPVSSEALTNRVLPVNVNESGVPGAVFGTFTLDNVQVRTVHLPIFLKETGQQLGAVNVGEPLIQVDETVRHVRRLLLLGGVVGVALAALAGYVLAGRALRPVDRMTAAAAAIANDPGQQALRTERLAVSSSGDELARLAATFNAMLDRLGDTFDRQRRFVADASHELRTPLTAIRGNVDVLARQADAGPVDPSDLRETLGELRRESARMSRLVDELLELARTESLPESTFLPVRLDQVANDAVRSAGALARGQRVWLDAPDPVWVSGDEGRLEQVLLILLDNAIRHTPVGGEVSVSIRTDGQRARIQVRDTGDGIPPEHLARIFDRFYRADASRDRDTGGAGLGLAIARSIVTMHRGTIGVSSQIGAGTTFSIDLPAITPPALTA